MPAPLTTVPLAKLLLACVSMTALATAITAAGSAWAAGPWRGDGSTRGCCGASKLTIEEEAGGSEDAGQVHIVTLTQALLFVVFAGAGLLAIWCFPNALVYVSIASFAVGSFFGAYYITRTILCYAVGVPRAKKSSALTAALLVAGWFVTRNSDIYWPLQDLLCAALVAMSLAVIKLPNLKVATALLSATFLYDVFFTLLTPLLTRKGDSVMESAASGAGITVGERIPMLLRFPVAESVFAVLGLGDMIVPGLLMTLLRQHDVRLQIGKDGPDGTPIFGNSLEIEAPGRQPRTVSYHRMATAGYALGIVCSFGGSLAMGKGQPALMYIVPCILLPVLCTTQRRKDWPVFWLGFESNREEDINV